MERTPSFLSRIPTDMADSTRRRSIHIEWRTENAIRSIYTIKRSCDELEPYFAALVHFLHIYREICYRINKRAECFTGYVDRDRDDDVNLKRRILI